MASRAIRCELRTAICAVLPLVILCTPLSANAEDGVDRPGVLVFALPSTSPDARLLKVRAERLHRMLAAELRGRTIAIQPPRELEQLASRARQFADSGAIAEATATYDAVLEAVVQSPEVSPAPQIFGEIVFPRVALALAEKDDATADRWLRYLFAWDFAVRVSSDHASPRMVSALASLKKRLGEQPPLNSELLGSSCDKAAVVVALRAISTGFEAVRFDHCARAASVKFTDRSRDRDIVQSLTATEVARQPTKSRRFYQRPWLWVTLGAIVAGSAAGILWATGGSSNGLVIEPRL